MNGDTFTGYIDRRCTREGHWIWWLLSYVVHHEGDPCTTFWRSLWCEAVDACRRSR